MKKLLVFLTGLILLAGCSPACNVDQEFGKTTQKSLDQQVAYPDYRYANKTPEGMEGIDAEVEMEVLNKTFAEKPQKTQKVDVFQMGTKK